MRAEVIMSPSFILLERETQKGIKTGHGSLLSANTAALCILLSRRINDTIHHDDKLGFIASLKRQRRKEFKKKMEGKKV